MESSKKDIFATLIKIKNVPILMNTISDEVKEKSSVIDATVDFRLLSEYFYGEKFNAPLWYENLMKMKRKVLVISNLAKVDHEKQKQFIEILKYRKINEYELSNDCIILVSCKKEDKHLLCGEVYSLLAQI